MAEAGRPVEGPPEEPGLLRTMAVAFAVCAVCSLLVSGAVVGLRPWQRANQERERERRVQALVAGLPGVAELLGPAGEVALEVRVVDLATGTSEPATDAASALAAEGEPEVALPPERDLARIGRRPRRAPVYLVRRGGELRSVILPLVGRGYLSLMRGYLALAGDADTVRGITFTEQEETPGLGAEIESPAWRARWEGKRLRDAAGEIRIRVVSQAPPEGSDRAAYEVQGISGATKTGDGVTDMVRFWVGPDGFGPYLERLREGKEP